MTNFYYYSQTPTLIFSINPSLVTVYIEPIILSHFRTNCNILGIQSGYLMKYFKILLNETCHERFSDLYFSRKKMRLFEQFNILLKVKFNKEVEAFVFHISYKSQQQKSNKKTPSTARNQYAKKVQFSRQKSFKVMHHTFSKKILQVKEAKKIIIRDNFRSYC